MDNEYRYVGNTPTDLDDGRPIGPGEYTGPLTVDEDHPQNKLLVDEGKLLLVQSDAELKAAKEAENKQAADQQPDNPAAKQQTGKNDKGENGGEGS